MSGGQSATTQAQSLSVLTIVRYLLGSRDAILAIVNTPGSLWLGLLFVLSTGFAREYDAEDLLREPWHLFLPLVASLVTSFFLYSLLYWKLTTHRPDAMQFAAGYRTFLSLYWLTAPLAWIYAIPVERMVSPIEATAINFLFLALVSIWRVLLITRVVCVWFNAQWWCALPIVLIFADTVLVILSWTVPKPIFSIMGGIQLSETDALVSNITCATMAYSVLAWPVILIVAIVVAFLDRGWEVQDQASLPAMPVGFGAWLIGAVSVLAWIFVLPFTQAEQQRRTHAERLLYDEQIPEAFEFLSQYEREDFPPIWDPPPRSGYGERQPSLWLIQLELRNESVAEWVRIVYHKKFLQFAKRELYSLVPGINVPMNEKMLSQFVQFFDKVEHSNIDLPYIEEYNSALDRALEHPDIDEPLRIRIREYLKSKGEEVSESDVQSDNSVETASP